MMRNEVLVVALAAVQAAPLHGQRSCWIDGGQEQIGQRGEEWVLQKSFGDLRVCAVASRVPDADDVLPSDWFGGAAMVLFETSIGTNVHRMWLARGSATFAINDSARAIDSTAKEWHKAIRDLVDATWLLSRLRARDSVPMAGRSPARRRDGSGQAIVASVPADLAAMRQERAELKATSRSLGVELSTLRAEQRRLMADIQIERSSIATLQSSLARANQNERGRINREIRQHYTEIRRLEQAMSRNELDARSREDRIATMDRRIRKLDRETREFDANPVLDSVRQADSAGLDVERLTRQLESHAEAALQRLRSALRNR